MSSAVLDSTVLVSAFLTPGGVAGGLLNQAKAGRFLGVLAAAIVAEAAQVLLERPCLRHRAYLQGLRQAVFLVFTLSPRSGIVVTSEALLALLRPLETAAGVSRAGHEAHCAVHCVT